MSTCAPPLPCRKEAESRMRKDSDASWERNRGIQTIGLERSHLDGLRQAQSGRRGGGSIAQHGFHPRPACCGWHRRPRHRATPLLVVHPGPGHITPDSLPWTMLRHCLLPTLDKNMFISCLATTVRNSAACSPPWTRSNHNFMAGPTLEYFDTDSPIEGTAYQTALHRQSYNPPSSENFTQGHLTIAHVAHPFPGQCKPPVNIGAPGSLQCR